MRWLWCLVGWHDWRTCGYDSRLGLVLTCLECGKRRCIRYKGVFDK